MLTVKSFLDKIKQDRMLWYKILSGESLIASRSIEYVSVCEYPAEDFIRKNELILSGLISKAGEENLLEFIQDLSAAGASALIISHPENNSQLPDSVTRYLDKHPFPIIFIPWEYRYADVVQFVLKLLNNATISENSRYESIQKKLLESYLQGMEMDDAAGILSDSFCCPVAIFDVTGDYKACSYHLNHLNQSEIINMIHDNACTINIETTQRLYGTIHFFSAASENLPNKAAFLSHLSWPLTLWFEKGRIIQIVEQGLRDDFIWKITKSPIEDFDAYYEEGKHLGFYLGGSYTCVVGNICVLDSAEENSRDLWLATYINSLKETILQTARRNEWRVMVTYQNKNLILYLQSIRGAKNDTIDSFLDALEEKLQAAFPSICFAWGISDPGGDPTDFHKCFQNAKLAQELCPGLLTKNTRFTFRDTILNRVISSLRSETSIREILMSRIEPLLDYDKKTNSDFFKTLQCYLECKNYSETARRMHLHRHSLLYRIDKITELCGLSIQEPDDFLILELCVRLYVNHST